MTVDTIRHPSHNRNGRLTDSLRRWEPRYVARCARCVRTCSVGGPGGEILCPGCGARLTVATTATRYTRVPCPECPDESEPLLTASQFRHFTTHGDFHCDECQARASRQWLS
jgi:hypothetical protein